MSVEIGPIKIIVMGQSLGSGLSRSYDGATTDGVDQLTQHFQDRTKVPVEVLQASVPATSLLRRYRSRRSWWDETTHKPGRLLLQTTFMYPEADIVLWSQGERDAEDAALDIETYEASLKEFFIYLRQTYGCFVICNFIGRRIGGNDHTTQSLLLAQRRVVTALDFVFEGAEQYHVDLIDAVHPDNAGFGAIGALSGHAIAAACLNEANDYPMVTHVEASDNVVVFYLSGADAWAINGAKVDRPIKMMNLKGDNQFSVVSQTIVKLVPSAMFFDPTQNEVYLVFEASLERMAADLRAYVAYGACSDLDRSRLLTEASVLSRPIRRDSLALDFVH